MAAFRVTPAKRGKINASIRRFGLSQQRVPVEVRAESEGELEPIFSQLRAWGKNLNQVTILICVHLWPPQHSRIVWVAHLTHSENKK